MGLADTFVRQVKHSGKAAGDKYTDGNGMYLLVKASGKYWRMDYTYANKRKTLALGVYPDVPTAKARERRGEARRLLAYVAFAAEPVTRAERATVAHTAAAVEFTDKQQAFVDFVLAQYVRQGVDELDAEKLSPLLKLKYNNALADAVKDLGSPEQIRQVFVDFQRYLYSSKGQRRSA